MPEFSESLSLLSLCWRYLVLGIVQGLTEFLPISSTAHLKAVPMLLGWGDPGIAVSAVIQLGSIFAVFAYFKRDLQSISEGIFLSFKDGKWSEPNARLGIAICIGTSPILLAGLLVKQYLPGYEHSFLRGIPSIGLVSILMAAFLAIAESSGLMRKSLKEVSGMDGLMIGLAQVLAIVPGVSRSGITLTTALFSGWRRSDAARFSFLLGIPAISIAGLVELKDVLGNSVQVSLIPLLVGLLSAAVTSWLSIHWLLKYLQTHSTWIFVFYRIFFGFSLLALWLKLP